MNDTKEPFCFRRHSTTPFKCKRNHSLVPHPKSTIAAKHPSAEKTEKLTWYLNIDGRKSTHVNKWNAPQEPLSGRFYFPHLGGSLEGWGVTLFRVTRALMLIGKMKRNRRGGVWISDDGKSDFHESVLLNSSFGSFTSWRNHAITWSLAFEQNSSKRSKRAVWELNIICIYITKLKLI